MKKIQILTAICYYFRRYTKKIMILVYRSIFFNILDLAHSLYLVTNLDNWYV